jgi:DNA primase
MDCTFNASVDWICKFLVERNIDPNSEVVVPIRSSSGPVLKTHEPLNEALLKYLQPKYDLLLARGYKEETLKKFQIGLWSRLGTFMHNRLIFPIRDVQGSLVGFSGRTIYPEVDWEKYQVKAKWVHGRYYDRWPKLDELKTGSLLFNLDRAKEHVGLQKTLILVEGPLDGLRLDEAGIYNWVALLGCSFGPVHRSLLVSLGINNLVLALDVDKAGTNATSKIEKSLSEFFHIHRPVLQNDPGKSAIEELRKVFNAY